MIWIFVKIKITDKPMLHNLKQGLYQKQVKV